MISNQRVSRYAPSPTGALHLGNLRTALLAWLQARLSGAKFILRIEDLDFPRVKPDSAVQIIEDLLWLGLNWDNEQDASGEVDYYLQSERSQRYQQTLLQLYQKELVYPCYCSRKDIRDAASAPHGKLPIYPGICRDKYPKITPENEKPSNGRLPAWRLKVNDRMISFEDKLMGNFSQNLKQDIGDFVVRRSDGLFAYQLAVVVDDVDMGITDVLRGEDLLDSTCRQIALFEALDMPIPNFWHVALMNDQQGKRMAKRDGTASLAELRSKGISPQSVIGQLAQSCGLVESKLPIAADELLYSLTLEVFINRLKKARQTDNV